MVAFVRIRLQFLECFRSYRPSSVSAAPSQLPRRGSSCTMLWGAGGYWKRFRPFTCGTAHRPFPTVRLGLIPFAPVVPIITNAALRPSQSRLRRASSPRGRAKAAHRGRGGVYHCGNNGRKRATSVPQKLSIVNCPLSIGKNCQLSTVNCQLPRFPVSSRTTSPAATIPAAATAKAVEPGVARRVGFEVGSGGRSPWGGRGSSWE